LFAGDPLAMPADVVAADVVAGNIFDAVFDG
jgi:hypothetical protein